MPYQLIVVQGRSTAQTVKLGDGITTVGRQNECQLRIASSQVSRKHCELFEKKGLLLVKDLGSSNGTFVNGTKIEGQRVLEPSDELSVGNIKFRVEKVEETALMPGVSPSGPSTVKPADTAISEAIAVDDDTTAPAEDATQAVSPRAKKPAASHAQTAASETPTQTIGEDEVAEFLLNIELDDEDKI